MNFSLESGREACRSVALLRVWMLACLTAVTACRRSEPPPQVDHFTWINPVTAMVVELPEGWRHSPETAAQGETTVGYFTPNFARMFGRYGHVTLHHEYLDGPAAPMTLERFVDNFARYVRHRGNLQSRPTFVQRDSLDTARLSVQAFHREREVMLDVEFWTRDNHDFWYAVIESEVDDGRFPDIAAPVVEQLRRSTLLK